MSTERIDIVVREDGSREVRRNLEDIGSSASRGASGVDRLQGALSQLKVMMAAMGISAGIAEIIKYTDTWANLQGRLALVTNSYEQMRQVQTQLFSISQKTRVGYEGTADVYTRIARATKEMNTTDTERLKVVENINKALIISGASEDEGHRALIQLGQGLSTGILRGQDLNSVLEQTPRLAQAIAEGMGKTTGELKKMGEAGTLTSKAVFQALLNSGAALNDEFAQMPQTIGQSFTLLKNEVLKFVGTTSEANGTAGNFATVLSLLANNLNVVAAVMQGMVAYKLAEFFLTTAAAVVKKYLAIVDSTNAMIAERAASIASAEAAVAHAGAQLAVATATQAAIVTSREEQVVRLAQANANIAAARAAMAAATAAGAQSFAMYTLRNATAELAVAEQARTAALAALAVLGQQQTRVSAQITIATEAELAATTALTAARSAGAGAAGLASRALGLLGGPIGIVTTLLSVGVTAWALWGNKAKTTETEVAKTLSEKTQEVVADLNKQIEKLKERNRLAQVDPELAKSQSPVADQKGALLAEIDAAGKGTGKYDFSALPPAVAELAKSNVLAALGAQYNNLSVSAAELDQQQGKLNKTLNGDKLKQFLNSHEELLSDTEKLAKAIADAKKELGDAFNPEIEKRITDSMGKKAAAHDSLLQYKETLEALKMQQKLQKEIADGQLSHLGEQYNQGGISQDVYLKAQRDAKLAENQQNIEFTMKELDLAKGAGKEQVAARAQYNGELAVLAQKRLNIEQDYNDQVAGVFNSRTRAEIDAGNAEITALNDKNKSLEDQIAYFNMLPDAITRATIAELEDQKAVLQGDFADQAKITAINGRIEALGRLAGAQTKSQQQQYDYDLAQKTADAWRKTGDVIGNALSTAFGKGGQAIGKLVQSYTGLKAQETDLKKQYDDRVKVAAGSTDRIKEAEDQYRRDTVEAQYGAYADMAGALKGYTGEHTAAYKILTGAEQAFRIVQMAMAYESMIRQLFFTTTVTTAKVTAVGVETAANVASVGPNVAADGAKATASGIAAVAKTLASLPFPFNVAAGAAVLAMLVGLGVSISGGGGASSVSMAEQRQKDQGTGTVLGDATKKSDSIAKSIDHLASTSDIGLKYSAGMLASLHNIESGIGGLSGLLVRGSGLGSNLPTDQIGTAAGIAQKLGNIVPIVGSWLGKQLGSLANSIFGGKQTVTDTGFTMSKGSLASLVSYGATAKQYADVTTDGGWFSSDKHDTKTTDLGKEANDQFTKIIQSMADGITSAGGALGVNATEFKNRLGSFVVDIGKISLKGLTGDEVQKQLEAVFSKLGDDMAKYAFAGLDQFQKVGEGYFETLMRVAGGVDAANYELSKLGVAAVSYTDIANKQGDVELELIRQSLVATESGKGMVDMLQNFSGTADDLVSSYKDLLKVRQMIAAAGLNGNNLSADTVNGAGGLSELTDGAQTFFEKFLTDAEQHASKLKSLNDEFTKMGITAIPTSMKAFKDLVLSMDDGSEKGERLVGKLLTMSGAFADLYDSTSSGTITVDDARKNLTDAYNREVDAITKVKDRMSSFAKTLRDLHDSALLGDLSPLTPGQKYAEAKSQYEQVLAAARSGDEDAQGKYSDAYTAFLNASKAYNMSDDAYQRDFQYAQQATADAAAWASKQVDVQQESLDRLNKLVDGLIDVKAAVLTVPDAIAQLADAINGKEAGTTKDELTGLYKDILGRAPDQEGYDFWAKAAASGVSMSHITDEFQNSPEKKIQDLYKSLLDRQADDAGLKWYMDSMRNGATIDQVANWIKTSSEYLGMHGGAGYTAETPTVSVQALEATVATPVVQSLTSLQADNQALAEQVQALRDDQAAQTDAIVQALLQSAQMNGESTASAVTDVVRSARQLSKSTVSID